jgi:hypothetical protein
LLITNELNYATWIQNRFWIYNHWSYNNKLGGTMRATLIPLLLAGASLAVIVSFLAGFEISKQITYMDMQAMYARPLQLYIIGLDELASAGRTNEVHKACQTFMRYPTLSWRDNDVSNFTSFSCDTYDKAEASRATSATNRP